MNKQNFMNWTVDSSLRIVLIFLLILIGFLIFKPFLLLLVWSVIISISLYPIFKRFSKAFKGNKKIASITLTVLLLVILIYPTYLFIDVLVDNVTLLGNKLQSEKQSIPPPPEKVKEWPIIGNSINNVWNLASDNLEAFFENYKPQISKIGDWLVNSIENLIESFFLFIGAIIIAGIFYVYANSAYSFTIKLSTKIAGQKGKSLIDNSIATIRSVVKGVLGVALIQSALIGIGFFVADIPGASILTIIVFILSLVQIPSIIVVIPVIAYVFSTESTTYSILFTIYSLAAGVSDNILKPMLLGKGVQIPMLVILIGCIGGMILMGIVGLFVGPVILAVLYQLFTDWINSDDDIANPSPA